MEDSLHPQPQKKAPEKVQKKQKAANVLVSYFVHINDFSCLNNLATKQERFKS